MQMAETGARVAQRDSPRTRQRYRELMALRARITLAVIFIAAQRSSRTSRQASPSSSRRSGAAAAAVLSYFTAGVAKLISPIWRSGGALPAILGTYGHGVATVSRIMTSRPAVGFVLGWAVILFEVSFPLVLLAPSSVAIAVLGIGLTFHLVSAVLMGLNSFLWPFPATYACVLAARARSLAGL